MSKPEPDGDDATVATVTGVVVDVAHPGDEAQLAAGTVVDGFVIAAERRRGGYSMVYRARDGQGRDVALKVLRERIAASDAGAERFAREAALLQRLVHARVVVYLGSGRLDDGRPYMAMEWLAGHSLAAELARRGPLTLHEALEVVDAIADALAAAHALGVVHRDLKAQNVMVAPRPSGGFDVKVVDFGIAKDTAHAGMSLTSSSMLMGTPLNMAPEQILGEKVDARTDVYALGLLAYQLVTGRLPFVAPTMLELEQLHLSTPAPRPSERAPVPAGFDAFVSRCLRKSANERFADMSAVREAIAGMALGRDPAPGGHRVRVEASVRGEADAIEDAALDDVDRTIEIARETLRSLGLQIELEGSAGVTAIADDAAVAEAAAERVRMGLARRPGEHPAVTVTVSVEGTGGD